jgi:hypothetical protein
MKFMMFKRIEEKNAYVMKGGARGDSLNIGHSLMPR